MQVAENKEVKSKESSKSELGSEMSQRDIEITPEMIRAGVLELAGYDPDFELQSEIVERVYLAMAEGSAQSYNVFRAI